jgi:glycosyltransferase involved in cell wall biosynthesis
VVFPASALSRKGSRELAAALQGLDCELLVLGSAASDARLWQGLRVRQAGWASGWLGEAAVVVMPAHIEHSPRAALMAIAAGVPVIATRACGLDGQRGVDLVLEGDVAGLRAALQRFL